MGEKNNGCSCCEFLYVDDKTNDDICICANDVQYSIIDDKFFILYGDGDQLDIKFCPICGKKLDKNDIPKSLINKAKLSYEKYLNQKKAIEIKLKKYEEQKEKFIKKYGQEAWNKKTQENEVVFYRTPCCDISLSDVKFKLDLIDLKKNFEGVDK